MKVITEAELRDIYKKSPFTSFDLPTGMKLTPAASQFLSERKIKILRDGVAESVLAAENKRYNVSAPTPAYPQLSPSPQPLADPKYYGGQPDYSGVMQQGYRVTVPPVQAPSPMPVPPVQSVPPVSQMVASVPPVSSINPVRPVQPAAQAASVSPFTQAQPVAPVQPVQPRRSTESLIEASRHKKDTTAQNMDTSHTDHSKPEHMTHLRGSQLVPKVHPIIAFRGQLDSFEAMLLELVIDTETAGFKDLSSDLNELLTYSRSIMRAEVMEEPLSPMVICGWDSNEIRERSHYPNKFYNVNHFTPEPHHGKMMAQLNRLRAKSRELELAAAHAFYREDGSTDRDDILKAVNRFSSLIYVFMLQLLGGVYKYGA